MVLMLSPFLKASDHCIAPPSRPFNISVIDYDLLSRIWSMHELLEMSPEFKSTFKGLFSQASAPHVLPAFNCSICLPIFHLLLRKLGLEAGGRGQRSRSPLFSGWGGQEGEDGFLACSGEQKVYPPGWVGGSLWSMVDP